MSAFMMATITVKDPEKFQQDLAKTQAVAAAYAAEILFRGKNDRSLTAHDKDHGVVVIVRLPSIGKIKEWLASEENQPLIPLRDGCTEMKMTSYNVVR